MDNWYAIRNPQMRMFFKDKFQFQGLTATAVLIPQNRLVEISSNAIQKGTDDDANIIGANMEGNIAISGTGNIDFGAVEVLCSGDFSVLDKVAGAADGRVRKYIAAQSSLLGATAGGNFANQPAGEAVSVVSDSTDDDSQTVTLYFTKTGATTTVTTETVTLDGTTPVVTTTTTVQQLLAIVISAAHAGTITFKQGTSAGTITTIATGTLSAGYTATSAAEARGAIPTVKGSGASTTWFGVLGVGVDGAALSAAVATNGTSDVNLGAVPFDRVTFVLHGAVASSVNVTTETKDADTNAIGIAMEAGVSASLAKIFMRPFGI